MSVDSSPVKFTPARPGQPVPDIKTISGGRPVFRAELPDGRLAWLVSGHETVRQMIIDQRFSRLPGLRLAVPAGDLEFKPGMAIHSLRELPVRWGEP